MPRILLNRTVTFQDENPESYGLNKFVHVTAGVPTDVPEWVVKSDHFKLLGIDGRVDNTPAVESVPVTETSEDKK